MEKYPLAIRIMHWLMAFLIIMLLAVGLTMTSLPREEPLRATIYAYHKSFGVTVFLLCLLRIYFRRRLGVPALPQIISVLEQKLAHAGHYLFYFFALAMPLSGYLMTNSYGFTVKLFGTDLPRLVGPDKAMGELFSDFHTVAGFSLIFLILLHVAGALKHYLVEHVNLFRRMI